MHTIHQILRGVSVLVIAAHSAGCAFDSGARIRVTMPGSSSSQSLISFGSNASNLMMGPPAPASYSGFNCFGLNVTGPGISKSPLCPNAPDAGALGGLAAFSGGTVDVRVQPGTDRHIQLVGAMTSDGSCPVFSAMSPTDSTGPSISTFLIGETTVDVFEDKRVSIQAAYTDATSAIPILENCGDSGTGGMFRPDWFSGVMGFWLDASTSSISGPVATWSNSGPQAVAFQQPTGINQLSRTLDVAGPGIHMMSFLDASGNMSTTDPMYELDSPTALTVFTVIQVPASPASSTLLGINYAGTQTLSLSIVASTGQLIVSGTSSGNDTETTPNLNTNIPTLVQATWTPGTGAGVVLRVNGGSIIDATPTVASIGFSSTVASAMVGSAATAPAGVLLGDVVVYGADFAPMDREQIECYFKAKYGIAAISNPQCP